MAQNDAKRKDLRTQWAEASPTKKAVVATVYIALMAVLVYAIIHNMGAVFEAGRRAAR